MKSRLDRVIEQCTKCSEHNAHLEHSIHVLLLGPLVCKGSILKVGTVGEIVYKPLLVYTRKI